MENPPHELHVHCPECGSDDVQVERYLAEDRTLMEKDGLYCFSCGYLEPKTIVRENKTSAGGFELKMRTNHSSNLVLRKDDIDDRKAFLLTTTDCKNFCIHGGISVREAKAHPEWLATDGGGEEVWVVPRSALHSARRNPDGLN